jgi:hypothetical protein
LIASTHLRSPVVAGASVVGSAHVRSGRPCQDAFACFASDRAVVVSVADGLGSAKRSDLGASVAVQASTLRALEMCNGDPVHAAEEGIVAGREALETVARCGGYSLRELACTLIVAVIGDRVGISHIGDGAAVGWSGDEAYVLSPPGASEYVNETDPLTAKDWTDRVRSVACVGSIEGVALFTDGCHHAAVRRSNGSLHAHAGFFGPLFGFVRSGVSPQDASTALEQLLAGPKMSEHSDDDKTLVIAALR